MSEDLYEFFDINKDASKEEIKKAYRKKAKETHPDKNKEKREDFEKANKYYLVLIDDKKRENYDKTGKIDNNNINNTVYIQFLCQLFKNMIDKCDGDFNFNIFDKMKDHINNNINNFEINKSKIKDQIKKYKKLKKRIKSKLKKEENIFLNVIDDNMKNIENRITIIDNDIKLHKEAYDYLVKGKFDFEYEETYTYYIPFGSYTTGTGF